VTGDMVGSGRQTAELWECIVLPWPLWCPSTLPPWLELGNQKCADWRCWNIRMSLWPRSNQKICAADCRR